MKLTRSEKRALMQIGYGVTAREGGYFDETNHRLNIVAAQSLLDAGLISYGTTGGVLLRGSLYPTKKGWQEFEAIQLRVQPTGGRRRKNRTSGCAPCG